MVKVTGRKWAMRSTVTPCHPKEWKADISVRVLGSGENGRERWEELVGVQLWETRFGQGHSGARREQKAQPLTAMHLAIPKSLLSFRGHRTVGVDTKTQYSKKLVLLYQAHCCDIRSRAVKSKDHNISYISTQSYSSELPQSPQS